MDEKKKTVIEKNMNFSILIGDLDELTPLPPKTLKVYVCCNKEEFELERIRLWKDTVPYLQHFCVQKGLDLVWADVQHGGCLDHVMESHAFYRHLEEIRVCKETSVGPFFLCLLGNKYGDFPLPLSLYEKEFNYIRKYAADEGKYTATLEQWYIKDENSIPPQYYLRSFSDPFQRKSRGELTDMESERENAYKVIADIISSCTKTKSAKSAKNEEVVKSLQRYLTSGLEQQIQKAIQLCPGKCIFVQRTISDITGDIKKINTPFIENETKDQRQKYEELQQMINATVPSENRLEFTIKWKNEEGISPLNPEDHTEYLEIFSGFVANKLKELTENYLFEESVSCNLKRDLLYQEALLHLHHCRSLNSSFSDLGIENIMEKVHRLLENGAKKEHYAIMVKGPGNSGKSMFMSKLCYRARELFGKDTALIVRFVGLTPSSTDCENTLKAICIHLNQILQQNLSLKCYNMSKLRNYFHGLLNRVSKGNRHVVLVVDSIDMLCVSSAEADPIEKLDWIASKLPAKLHLIVSYNTSPLTPVIQRLEEKNPLEENKLTFTDCTEEEAKLTVQLKLKSKMRMLSKEQESFFLGVIPTVRSPSVTSLLMDTACRMPSYYNPGGISLPVAVEDIVTERLMRLEKIFGGKLIRSVCRYITLAKDGLSEMEILDVLSCNNELLLATFSDAPPRNLRFPFQKWLHVKEELGTLLCTRLVHGKYLLRWSHPTISAALRKRYLYHADTISRAQVELADIFMETWVKTKPLIDKDRNIQILDEATRYVCPQPLLYNERQYNLRRIHMLWMQLLQSGKISVFKENTLCSFEYLLAMAHSLSGDTLLENLRITTSNLLDAEIILIFNSLTKSRNIIKEDPLQLANELIGRLRHITDLYPDRLDSLVTQCMQWCDNCDQPLLIPLTTWLPSPFIPLATSLPDVPGCRVLTAVYSNQHAICTVRHVDIALYHVPSGRIVKSFLGHKGTIKCLHIYRGGRDFVSGDENGVIRLWDTTAGQCKAVIREHEGAVNSVVVSNKHNWVISGSEDTTVVICSLEGKKLCILRSHSKGVVSVRVNSSNSILASGSKDKTIVMWSLDDLTKLGSVCDGIHSPIACMELTNDNTFLIVGCEDNSLHVLSFITGSWIHELRGHEGGVKCIDVSNDCLHVAVGCWDGNVYLYNLRTTDLLETFKGSHSEPVKDICISRHDHFIFCATENKINVWNFYKRKMSKGQEHIHSGAVLCVHITDDGRYALSGGEDGVLKVWNLELCIFKENLLGHSAGITCIGISSDNSYCVTGSRDRTLLLWSLELLAWVVSFKNHEYMIQKVNTLDNDRILSYDVQGHFYLWQAETGSTLATFNIAASAFVVSKDSQYLVTSKGDHCAQIWNTENGSLVGSVSHTTRISCIASSKDDKHLVTASEDGSLKVWEFTSGKLTQVLVDHESPVGAVAIQTNGVVSGSEKGVVIVWDLSSGEPRHRLMGHTDRITVLQLSVDEKFAFSASKDHTIRVWSIQFGCQVTLISMHIPVIDIALTTDARRIVVHLENDHHVPLLSLHNSPVDTGSNHCHAWVPPTNDQPPILPLDPIHILPRRHSVLFTAPKLPIKRRRSSMSSIPQIIKLSPIKSQPKPSRARFRVLKMNRKEANPNSKLSKMCIIL